MRNQKGFTLLEIVIAVALVLLITAVVTQGLGPWIKFKQRLETEQNLGDLVQATTAMYKANAYSIDNANLSSALVPVLGPNGMLNLGPPLAAPTLSNRFRTDCQAGDPADTTSIQETLIPLGPYLSKSIVELAQDGFNNKLCILVSPRQSRYINGTRLYYHSVAFISPGDNTILDTGTDFLDNGTGMTLTLVGDDTGKMVDGFKIALDNYQTTMTRLQKLASAYETYFQIRFLTKADRDISINYFYGNTGDNNGDPGDIDLSIDPGPTAPQTRINLGDTWIAASFDNVIDVVADPSGSNRFSAILGVGDLEGRDGWGNPILVDNRSQRVKAGVLGGVKMQPPFSASFGALLPGSGDCSGSPNSAGTICLTYISANAVGKY